MSRIICTTHMMKTADKLTKKVLLLRFGPSCYICGRMNATDPAHMVSRSYMATRFDTHENGNVHMMHRTCHDIEHRTSFRYYVDKFIGKSGEEAYYAIRDRANKGIQFKGQFVQAAIERLEAELQDTPEQRGESTDPVREYGVTEDLFAIQD